MIDISVTYDVAKLAKEKGFPQNSFGLLYNQKGTVTGWEMDYTYQEEHIGIPTQFQLQTWLRETHNIHIELLLNDNPPYDNFFFRIMKVGKYFPLSHEGFYGTYEEVLEEGLKQSLNLIL